MKLEFVGFIFLNILKIIYGKYVFNNYFWIRHINLLFILNFKGSLAHTDLIRDLFGNYDKRIRPFAENGTAVKVHVTIVLGILIEMVLAKIFLKMLLTLRRGCLNLF